MAAAALATAGATGGNMMSSLGSALIQSQTAMATNKANLMFQSSMVDRGEQSFKDIGLPTSMYWGGNSITSPNTMFHLGGSNFYEGSGVNTNLPVFTTSPYQQYNHAGQPSKYVNRGQASMSGTASQNGGFVRGETSDSSGQTDRVGLGAGRYSAVPPPLTTYNSAGTSMTGMTKDKYSTTDSFIKTRGWATQTGFNSRNFGTQVPPGFNMRSSNTQVWNDPMDTRVVSFNQTPIPEFGSSTSFNTHK